MTIGPRSRWLIALGLGGLSATGFAPLHWWPLALIGVAAWMGLVAAAPRLRSALAIGWWFGLGHFIIGNNWIATAFQYQDAMPAWLGWIAVSLLALYLALFPAVAAGLAWRWGRDHAARYLLIFAAAWIIAEWLRASLFTGFAWNPLGVIALDMAGLAQAAALIGTYGVSGLVILAAGGLWLVARREWQAGGAALAVVAVVALALLPKGDGPAKGPLIRVVQPNIGQQDKWREGFEDQNFARLASLSGRRSAEPRLLLWPEAAVPEYLEEGRVEDRRARARIRRLLGPRDIILTGGTALEWGKDGYAAGARNSLFAMDASGRMLARYDKAHLVPYGEYLPMRPILSAIGLSRLAPGDLDFWPGPGPKSYALPGFGTVGVQICYEIIFSGQVVDPAARPDFIFNPSNDAWFGPSGPPQHLAQARLRAIEEGLPIIRATPTGISAIIDARGRVVESLPWRTAGAIDGRLPAARAATPFSRAGNVFPLLFAGLLILLVIAHRRIAR
ncbi:Apolipoprotein N-acyltransferase [Sphingomonas laterariae]|uniref:Apolipoprotein N-acyltransferase n=1 Tax=Edaphosphingomonas laterariae TaxID=861865 RepID=A0A239JR64_9SPHN|nr:apolipoprotein N-acyltransferase [Sphingomonas laterariae]SNT08305.1 Apolipoprotein N-acyltransferase [Sphingomonas laterariae]